jgi:hypothetical protein
MRVTAPQGKAKRFSAGMAGCEFRFPEIRGSFREAFFLAMHWGRFPTSR